MKTVHVAEMIAERGRDGRVEAPDGTFSVALSSSEKDGTITPEHLFAGAYAACFLESLKNHAEKTYHSVNGFTVVGRAHLNEDERGEFRLQVDLRAALPGFSPSQAEHLMHLAHQTCPYSRATRGNVTVNLSFD